MKKFITIALAVAVLFSFAACQNGPTTYTLTGVAELKEGVYYLTGEELKADDFVFTAYTYDGRSVDFPASDISSISANAAGEVTASGNGISFAGKITTYAVDSITVDGSNAVKKVYYTTSNENYKGVDLTGVVITAKFTVDGTEHTKVVDSSEAEGTISEWTTADPEAEVTVTYATKPSTYTVELRENLIDKVGLKVKDSVENIYVGATVDASTFDMVATMLNGEENILAPGTDYKYYNTTSKEYDINAPVVDTKEAKNNISIQAKYIGEDGKVGLEREASTTIDVLANDPVGITVDATSVTVALDTDYKESGIADLAVNYVLADGSEGDELTYNAAEDGYTLSATEFKSTSYEKGDRVQITVTAGSFTKTFEVILAAKA